MKRLTIMTEKGAALKMGDTYPSEDAAKKDLMRRYRLAVDRLAAYEDTGLMPEEIMAAANRRHDCKIECLLEAHNKLLDEVQGLGGIDKIREVMQAPNDPLTLEELRMMDGKPVWVVGVSSIGHFNGHWDICDWENGDVVFFPYCMESPDISLYGNTWLAYRHRPEEEIE